MKKTTKYDFEVESEVDEYRINKKKEEIKKLNYKIRVVIGLLTTLVSGYYFFIY